MRVPLSHPSGIFHARSYQLNRNLASNRDMTFYDFRLTETAPATLPVIRMFAAPKTIAGIG